MSQEHSSLIDLQEPGGSTFDWPDQAAWLPELRQHGLVHFREHGLPARSVERWKYTRLNELEKRAPLILATKLPADAAVLPEPLLDAPVRAAFLDGVFQSIDGELPEGVRLLTLERALSVDDPQIRSLLQGLEIEDRAASMAALNTASLRQGLYLHVAPGVDAGQVLVQWATTDQAAGHLANVRFCVVLEEGARVELVEQFESAADTASQFNQVVQVRLERAARLQHLRLQQESDQAILVTATEIDQAGDSEYTYTGLDFGGGTVRHDVRARMREDGAACSLNGASLTRGRSHVDNHLDAEHLAMNCSSRQFFRAVLGDRSRVVFNGRVYVAPGADGTDAQQSSAGLLLSPLAEIDSKPELEIYADEVVASHGATVGQLDRDQLFYLQSRGLDPDAARNLLTMAFCRSVIGQIGDSALRETLETRLERALAAAGIGDG